MKSHIYHVAFLLALSVVHGIAEPISFNRDIRAILSENCFACHGFDSEHREADLRLDLPDYAYAKNAEGSSAIVPGKPDESMMWLRISSTDPDELMPPPESHKSLDPEEKKLIRQWIEQGAIYQKHWAFESPEEGDGGGIDDFVGAALRTAGVEFTPEADRPTLIRRVSMALTGLPPTIDELDAFVSDLASDAYERMVDHYLRSPRYGEEMARHWLDVARYGDTHGMHLDNERQTWAYRDWVVRAFNRNLSFDQFTIEQLAGDLLPEPTQDQLIATGFNRCNVTTGEGGSINEEFIFRYAVDRASTTAQAWLGLTAGCAVCHDHKYDPITTKEFYSLYAFFNSNADPAMDGNKLLTAPVVKVKPMEYDTKFQAFADREAAIQAEMKVLLESVVYADPAEADPKPEVEVSEHVWFDDSFPAGAQAQSSTGALTFVEEPVFSGKKSVKAGGPQMAQVYFEKGAPPQRVPSGGKFFVHVFLDPADPPEEVMLQFKTGGWNHRAYWGGDLIDWGKKDSPERFAAGALPESGEWVKLEFDANSVGLNADSKIIGLAFTVYGGTAYFDNMGVIGSLDPTTDPARSFHAWRVTQKGKDPKDVPSNLKAYLKEGPDKELEPEQLKSLRDYYLQQVCTTTAETFAPAREKLDAVQKERSDYDTSIPSTFVFNDLPEPRETVSS